MSGYVYFLRHPITGLVKIGYSVEPHKRKEALEREHGVSLEVVAVARADDPYRLEQELHTLAGAERVEGEWFRLGRPIERFRNVIADRLLDWSEAVRVAPYGRDSLDGIREAVTRHMGARGITQQALADELGLERANLTRMLSGRSGKIPEKWGELLEALGLKLTVVEDE